MACISAFYAYSWIYIFQLASVFLLWMIFFPFSTVLLTSEYKVMQWFPPQNRTSLTPQSSLPSKFSTCLLPFTDIHTHFLKSVFQDTQTHIHLFIIELYCLTFFFFKIFILDLHGNI